MSRNILLTLRYDGSGYHGWQLQNNALTVQQKMNEAVNAVFHEDVNVCGCSRTDTGVHANMFCCSFRTNKEIAVERIPDAVNYYLPKDVSVYGARLVPQSFHARFSCIGKEYLYQIYNDRYRNPFFEQRALLYPYYLDETLLNREAQSFLGKHDFSGFCSAGSEVIDRIRTIRSVGVSREDNVVTLRISGDGFLYNMVRIIVGTLISVNEGKIPQGSIPEIIDSRDRLRAGITAPAQGLYLNKVFYNGEDRT